MFGRFATPDFRYATVVAFGYLLLTLLLAYPVSLHPGTMVIADNPDTHLFLWTLAWDVHAFTSQPLALFDANIFHPNVGTLAYSENLLGSALLAAPVIWLTGNLVLALNLVQLATCVLCGLGAYVLARRLGISRAGAVLCGVVYLAAPPRFFRIGQLHLTAVQWVPFALAYFHTYLDHGGKRNLRIALGFLTLQVFSSGHGAVFLIVAMALVMLYRVSLGEPVAVGRRLGHLGVPGLLLLAPIAAMIVPYRAAQVGVGLKRSLENWLPSPESYLASPSHLHQYLQTWLTSTDVNGLASAWLFPGITVLILGTAAFLPGPSIVEPAGGWRERLRRRPEVLYLLVLIVSVSMFVPPPFSLWPWVYAWPGFNFIRVPSRFMILAMLALAVLLGAGFDRLFGGRKAGPRVAAALVAGSLLLAEYASMPLAFVPYTVEVPAIDRWLNTLPKPFAIAEVPMPRVGDLGAYTRHNTMAMLHATAHWQRTVHGYSGIQPALHQRLYDELSRFPDAVSLASLRDLGVTYVVVHEDRYPPDSRAQVDERFQRFAEQLRLEHTEGEGRVYRIMPPPVERFP